MKKSLFTLSVLFLVALITVSLGEEKYINPINNDSITLNSDNTRYIMRIGENVSEGHYEIGEVSQKIVFTPLGETEMDTWRFYRNAIYGGNIKTYAQPNAIISLTRGYYGLDTSPSSRVIDGVEFPRIPQAHVAFIDGGLFELSNLDKELKRASDETIDSWAKRILASGEKYLVGWYDKSLLDSGFMLCIWKDENGYQDCQDMLLGLWSEDKGYDTVFLNSNSEEYRIASEAYSQLIQKRK